MSGWDAAEGVSRTGTVLVTGAAGFVGRHVCQRFKDRGWHVTGLDIGDEFPDEAVNIVVSLAATAEPADAIRDPEAAYKNSVGIMVRTLEYASQVRARVLHVSTNEADPPCGPYGGSKACQEIVCAAYRDVQTTIVVTQSLFGEHQQPNKLIPTAIEAILNDQPVTLQRNGDGYASRPFMHVRNLADALVDLASRDAIVDKRVNVGAPVTYRLDWVVQQLAAALGREPRIADVPAGDRPGHEAAVDIIGNDLYGRALPYETVPALADVARWYQHVFELCATRS